MAETYEKLGIQLELDFSKLNTQLATLTRNLNQALKADAFKQVVDAIKGMETGTAKASDALSKATKKQQDYAKAAGASAEEIKKLDKAVTAYNQSLEQQARTTAQAETGRARAHREAEGAARHATTANSALNISLQNMTARIAEFYSIRTVMFAISTQLRDAVAGALDFSQSIHDVAAIAGSSRAEMDQTGDSIVRIATNSRYTAQEVGNLMQILAQAGISAKNLPQISEVVGMFATATGASPDQAAEVFTTALNVWKFDAEESAKIANILTAALNNSKLSVQGLSTAFNYLAPQAAQFGYSLEQTAGIIAGMSQAGVKASTIGTGVSQLLKELAVPKERLVKLLQQYKISLDEVNPRLRTFAEIADVFAAKNVAAEDVLRAVDSRVGRSLVTALTLGGDAFRKMTASVSDTSSVFVAYEKTMEGARVKLNVMKQELLALTVELGKSIGPGLALATEGITDVIRGLQTVPGQLTLATIAIGAATLAVERMTLACIANPILAGVTGGVLAISAAMALLGRDFDATRGKAQATADAFDKQAEGTQKLKDGLTNARIEAEGGDKALSDYSKAVKEHGEESEKVAKLKEKEVQLHKDTREVLYSLQRDYPAYFEKIDLEKVKYGELLGILEKVNKQRGLAESSIVDQYNSLNQRVVLNSALSGDADKIRSGIKGKYGGGRITNEMDLERYEKAGRDLQFLKEAVEKDLVTLRDLEKRIPRDRYKKVEYGYFTEKTAGDVPQPEKPTRPQVTTPKGKAGRTPTPNSDYLTGQTFEDYFTEQATKYAESRLKADRAANEIILRDKMKTEQERNEALLRIIEINQQIYEQEVTASYHQIDDNIYKHPSSGLEVKRNRQLAEKLKAEAEAAAKERRDAADAQANKDRDAATSHLMLTATMRDKQLAFQLKAAQQSAALRREEAATAAEVNQIDQELLQTTIRMGREKVGNLELDNAAIDHWIELNQHVEGIGDKLEAHKRTREQNLERIREENLLLQEQEAQLARMQDHSFSGAFLRGAKGQWRKDSDTDALTTELGATLTEATFNGVTDSIDGMVTALANGASAWGSFRQSLGNTLKEISAELQRYIIKMMVVYSVQQLIRLFGSSGADTVPALENVGGQTIATGMIDTAATGGLVRGAGEGIGTNPLMRLAAGGFIPRNIGVSGKDSVPALLMPGEFVIPKHIVDKYGVQYFENMRAQKYADGGLVGGSFAQAGSKKEESTDPGDLTLNIINVVDPRSIPKTTGQEILNVMNYEAAANGPTFKQWKAKITGHG